MKLRNSKTKLLCEISFKNEASKLKNQAFLRDFFKNDTSGTNRVTSDHQGDTPILCDRRGTPSTLGHLWPYGTLVACDPLSALHHSMVTIRLLHFNFPPHAFHTAMVYNVILHLDLLPAVHKAMVYSMYIYIYIYGHPPSHDPIVCFIHQKTLENTVFLLHTRFKNATQKYLKK